eukprot:1760574-Rhodomonas_salina.1
MKGRSQQPGEAMPGSAARLWDRGSGGGICGAELGYYGPVLSSSMALGIRGTVLSSGVLARDWWCGTELEYGATVLSSRMAVHYWTWACWRGAELGIGGTVLNWDWWYSTELGLVVQY